MENRLSKISSLFKEQYSVDQAFMFIGLVGNNQNLYTQLQKAGFILVFKPTVQYFESGKPTVKGNVDAELVLHAAAIQYKNYDKAIIITGDGDFACLMEFLEDNDKLLHIFTPSSKYSKLLKPFSKYIVEMHRLKKSIGYKKTGIGGRSKP
jgi:uncharacterized LabA/DUF88 family protein